MRKTKRWLALILTAVLVLTCLPMQALAEETETAASGKCGDNLTWTLDSEGTLTISGTGPMEDFEYGTAPWIAHQGSVKELTISSGVTRIGAYSFTMMLSINKVTIPETVETIGAHAFEDSGNFACVLPEGVTTIEKEAFAFVRFPSLTLPSTLEYIGKDAFCGISGGAEKVYVPDWETWCNIEFSNYLSSPLSHWVYPGPAELYVAGERVRDIVIPSNITKIGNSQYFNVLIPDDTDYTRNPDSEGWTLKESSFVDLVIPNHVTEIGDFAFGTTEADSRLRSVVVPGSVTSIGEMAFASRNLKEVTFMGNAPAMDQHALSKYYNNTGLTVYYPASNPTWTEEAMASLGGENINWVPYEVETTPMYRLYNPNSGEHFYTGSTEERDNLANVGWNYEGIAWNAPTNSGDPVYRCFNPNSSDHHYTMSWEEVENLVAVGWQYEGIAWNSAGAEGNVPQYRLYNPNAQCGIHHYTSSTEEQDYLVSLGWIYEGIGWYGMVN